MLVHKNGIARYNAVQTLLSPPVIFNSPRGTHTEVLRHHCASSFATSHQHRLRPLQLTNKESDDTDDMTSIVKLVSSIFVAPAPGIDPDLAIGYLLVLTTAFLILPISSAALLLGFFAAFSFAGRKLILEDYLEEQKKENKSNDDDYDDFWERPPTDLLALGSSILCNALLAPDSGDNTGFLKLDGFPSAAVTLLLLAIMSTFLVLGTNGEETPGTVSPQQELMELWDDQLAEHTEEETQERK
ncbi:MAG: hypothetical protein SGBAC_001342 [Bacillariaceae sp.]